MNTDLLFALINKGVIKIGTELGIIRTGYGIDGRAVATSRILVSKQNDACILSKANHVVEITNIQHTDSDFLIYGCSTVDGAEFTIKPASIFIIDGMTPSAIAKVYGLNDDGTSRRLGKKRGRKSNKEKAIYEQNNRFSQDTSSCIEERA